MPKPRKAAKINEDDPDLRERMQERVYSFYTRWEKDYKERDTRTADEKAVDEVIMKFQVKNTLMTSRIGRHGKWPFDASGEYCAKFWFSFLVYTMYNPGVESGLKGWMQTLIMSRLSPFLGGPRTRQFVARLDSARQSARHERLHGIFEDMHDAVKGECARGLGGSGH